MYVCIFIMLIFETNFLSNFEPSALLVAGASTYPLNPKTVETFYKFLYSVYRENMYFCARLYYLLVALGGNDVTIVAPDSEFFSVVQCDEP